MTQRRLIKKKDKHVAEMSKMREESKDLAHIFISLFLYNNGYSILLQTPA
jgi:hypothetical protein